jgi:hypothetical protein
LNRPPNVAKSLHASTQAAPVDETEATRNTTNSRTPAKREDVETNVLVQHCARPFINSISAKIPAVKRRTLLKALPAVTFLPASLWAASQQDNTSAMPATTVVYELRVYHAAPGKLGDLLSRFRNHTTKLFDRHGMKSVAYWTPLDEPEKSNTLIYILQHPSREAAAANWKSFQDDPEWKSVKEKSEANGKLTERIDSTFIALTDFSPRLR